MNKIAATEALTLVAQTITLNMASFKGGLGGLLAQVLNDEWGRNIAPDDFAIHDFLWHQKGQN